MEGPRSPLNADSRKSETEALTQGPRLRLHQIKAGRHAVELLRHILEREGDGYARRKGERGRRYYAAGRLRYRFANVMAPLEFVYVMCIVAHAIGGRQPLTYRTRFFDRGRRRFEIFVKKRFGRGSF